MNYTSGGSSTLVGGMQSVSISASGDASMGNQFDSHLKRLSEVEQRLLQIADALHGSMPQAAHPDKNVPRPMVSIASRVRDLGDAVASIENVINRIQGQL